MPKNSTKDELMQFLVEFARKDITAMNQKDGVKLRKQFERYIISINEFNPTGHLFTPVGFGSTVESFDYPKLGDIRKIPIFFDADRLSEFPENEIVKLQGDARLLLNHAIDLREHGKTFLRKMALKESWRKVRPVGVTFKKLDVSLVLPGFGGEVETFHIGIKGSMRAAFVLSMYELLRTVSSRKIARCTSAIREGSADKLCGNIFYRIKKQKFCSLRCTKRAGMRRIRAGEDRIYKIKRKQSKPASVRRSKRRKEK